MPNWKHLPVGYHGRAGTVVVSGTDIVRPSGQRKGPADPAPVFGPSVRLDIEAELGFVVGVGSPLGAPIPTAEFADHVFGVVLVNDWSARDLQAWEYVPLGPHLGKSFATSVSAWVVPLAALAAARVPLPGQHPPVLPYLRESADWGLDIDLAVEWNGEVVSRPPYRDHVLVARPDARAPDRQRRVRPHRRPVRLRHHLRARPGPARRVHRADLGRRRADHGQGRARGRSWRTATR